MRLFGRQIFGQAPKKDVLRYYPIDPGISIKSSKSYLLWIDWTPNRLLAGFFLPDDEAYALRVWFGGSTIVRLLDEMAYCTETVPGQCEGLVREHFAYRVEGAAFAAMQSEAWKIGREPVIHYQFRTGDCGMDVLSGTPPYFEVVERAPDTDPLA